MQAMPGAEINVSEIPEYSNLTARIKAVWQREQMLNATAGALAFLRWIFPTCLGGLFLDWLIQIPAPGRAVLLLVVLAVPLVMAWRAGWRKFRAFNPIHTALRIEALEGRKDSLLVTALQLKDSLQIHGASESLC